MISPRSAHQGGQGRQLSQTICYKQTGLAKPGVSKLSGKESHMLWQQWHSHKKLLPDPASALEEAVLPPDHPRVTRDLVPCWSMVCLPADERSIVTDSLRMNISQHPEFHATDAPWHYQRVRIKRESRNCKKLLRKGFCVKQPLFPKWWHTEGRRARKVLKYRTLNHRYFESFPAIQKHSPQPHFPSPTSW